MFYPQANGTVELREAIAALYPGATADDVLVTVGAAEANYLAITTFLEPGDEVVIVLPNYMQVWGVAKNRGCGSRNSTSTSTTTGPSTPSARRGGDPGHEDHLRGQPQQPHRPDHERGRDGRGGGRGRALGAWLLADEVYRGAERERDEETPSSTAATTRCWPRAP